MSGGGRVIFLGDFASESNFLRVNSILGGGLGVNGSYVASNYLKTAAATGTTFADDAADLDKLNSFHDITGVLPANTTVFFQEATTGDAGLFRSTVGSGDLFWFGYDFCCGGTATSRGEWVEALDSAINFDGGGIAPVPLPAGGLLLISALAGICFVRRKAA